MGSSDNMVSWYRPVRCSASTQGTVVSQQLFLTIRIITDEEDMVLLWIL